MEITAIICFMCTIVGCLVGYFGFRRNQNNDIRTETKEDTRDKVQLNTKLDVLLSNNTEIKGSVKELDKKLDVFKDDVNVKLAKLEADSTNYDKRITNLENRK